MGRSGSEVPCKGRLYTSSFSRTYHKTYNSAICPWTNKETDRPLRVEGNSQPVPVTFFVVFQLDPQKTILQLWSSQEFVQEALLQGFRIIYSTCWYLNLISTQPDWHELYDCNPWITSTAKGLFWLLSYLPV